MVTGKINQRKFTRLFKGILSISKAVPQFVENIASCVTEENPKVQFPRTVKEEKEHIIPWMKFADALGIPRDELIDYRGDEGIN